MTSWNSSSFIKSQIDSIFIQKDVLTHIYVSDDQSEDNTLEIINDITNDNNCTVLNNSTKFGKPGLNFFSLIERVYDESFDFYCFSDHDDIWDKNKLIKGIQLLIESTSEGYSSGFHLYFEDRGVGKFVSKHPCQKKYDYLFSSPGPGCTFILTKKSYGTLRKELIDYKKIFTRCYYHDWAIYAFFRANNLSWVIDNHSYILYRQHGNNDTGANKGLKAYLKRLSLFYNGNYENQIKDIINLVQIYNKEEMSFLKKVGILHYLFLILRFSRRNFLHRLILFYLHLFGFLNRRIIFNDLK